MCDALSIECGDIPHACGAAAKHPERGTANTAWSRLERVSERTALTWIQNGAVPVRRTPGGGIRIQPSAIEGPQTIIPKKGD
jgi:hypothetical protein